MIRIITLTLLLTGCATVHQTSAPDGTQAYTLNCSGMARGWDKCMSAAGDLCGATGYTVLDRSDEPMVAVGASFNAQSGAGFGGMSRERSMMVSCRAK